MINTLVRGMRRGNVWLGLAVVLAGSSPSVGTAAQQDKSKTGAAKKDGPSTKGAAPATKKADEPKKEEVKAEEAAAPTGSYEIFRDPRAEEAMEKLKKVGKDCPDRVASNVKSMAGGGSSVDRDAIKQLVQGMVFRLTDKANIDAVVAPPPNKTPSRAVSVAVENLIDPLISAKALKNTGFLNVYNQELLESLPPLLNNHLITRIQAAIVLAQIGTPQVVPIFVKELKDPKQTIWVKLEATRGISQVVDGGRNADALSATEAANTAKVIVDYLVAEAEQDLPWPVEFRAIEALGALRQAALPASPQKAEIAAVLMKYLADGDERPEVRAQAAAALGMLRVSSATSKYNFPLVAYYDGLLSAAIGERVNAIFPDNIPQSEYLTGLLVAPLYQCFSGLENSRESGLLKTPTAASSIGYLKQVSDLQSAVAKATVELIRAPTGLRKDLKPELGNRVSALKTFLAKNPPKDFHLVPGGEEYRVEAEPAVAQAAAPKAAAPAAAKAKAGGGR